ncbi:nitroreductase [Candidatus Scalindua japonica]|uniref:Nitroreductase n=1 Tax=Candidatus Scalindua japonica TaxID=1284222 RepID=A0A286TYJ8_9BACT|nr:nitroreductase family protein [Candidatus Scalindua japonica]GAX60979.1 nitroreductase [Candidatus Scalindua japonica]
MFMSIIQKRRSIRKFLNKPVEKEKIDLLIEAGLRSPSSRGFNPWEFMVITDRDLLEKLSDSKMHGSQFLKNAPLGIVVCADPEKCDVWVEDCSIASTFIFLAAESLGLRSCWIQIRERMHNETITSEKYVSNTLEIPSRLNVESIIAIGYPDETKSFHKKEELQFAKVYYNQYGKPYCKQT